MDAAATEHATAATLICGMDQVVVNYLKDAIVELTTHERVRWCYICVLIQAYYIYVSSY
jgi:hypothetical protein